MVAGWISTLDIYDFEIQHRKGSLHVNRDVLSREPRRKCCREECECTISTIIQSQSNNQSIPSILNVNWLNPWSDCEVTKLQAKDPCIKVVINLIRDKVE